MAFFNETQQPPERAQQAAPDKPEEQEEEGATGLLPRNLFGDNPQPGTRRTVEIVHVYDDEVEVKPVSGGETEQRKPKSVREEMAALDTT